LKYPINKVHFTLRLSTLFLCSLCIIACISTGPVSRDFIKHAENSSLQWPPYPQTPRILYIGKIIDPATIGNNQSWFSRTMNSLFGADNQAESLVRPYGVFADKNRIYITDPGLGCFHIIDNQKKTYFSIEETAEEHLLSPIGIAVDEDGYIYVSDSLLRKIFVFNKNGKYVRQIGTTDFFQRPAGIALNANHLYVVDTHGHRVLVFSKNNGEFLFSFGKNGFDNGNFNYPTNIFVSRQNLVYVTDSMNFRIQIFDQNGKFLSKFGKLGDGSGDLSKPKGIAVDSEGHIYLADAHFDNVQIFDEKGNLLLVFGNSGNKEGGFALPAGIFIDINDRIYVADSYNQRIQIFQYLKEKKETIEK